MKVYIITEVYSYKGKPNGFSQYSYAYLKKADAIKRAEELVKEEFSTLTKGEYFVSPPETGAVSYEWACMIHNAECTKGTCFRVTALQVTGIED